jgi:hypothetical protein
MSQKKGTKQNPIVIDTLPRTREEFALLRSQVNQSKTLYFKPPKGLSVGNKIIRGSTLAGKLAVAGLSASDSGPSIRQLKIEGEERKQNIQNNKKKPSILKGKKRSDLTIDDEQNSEILKILKTVERNKKALDQNIINEENNRLENPTTIERLQYEVMDKVEDAGIKLNDLPFKIQKIEDEDFGKIKPADDSKSIALQRSETKYHKLLAKERLKENDGRSKRSKGNRSEKQKAHMIKLHALRLGRINSSDSGKGSDVIEQKRFIRDLGEIPEHRSSNTGTSFDEVRKQERLEENNIPEYIMNAFSRVF